jgi:hypothetical protein
MIQKGIHFDNAAREVVAFLRDAFLKDFHF